MSETVETADSNQNDVRIQDGKSKTSFSQLRTLKRDMERQGSLLEKTWSELNNIMSQYQAELIEKHEEVESTGTPVDHNRIHQLEKHISELEEKLLRKDTEIVKLRTEVHKYKNEVSMKDSLIEKVQTQMTKEALEFQTEINSLKDLLEKQNSVWNTANTVVPVAPKRRKVSSGLSLSSVQIGELATTSVASSAGTKSESVRSSCDLIPSAPVFPSPQPINDPTSQSSDHDGSMDVSAYDANADDADSSQSQHRTILAGALKIEETDDSYASDVYASLEQQDLDPTQDDGMLSGASADVGQTNQILTENQKRRHTTATQGDICPYCMKVMANRWMLKRHIQSHIGYKPYRCGICKDHSCTQKSNLISHIMNRHRIIGNTKTLERYIDYRPDS